MLSTKEQAKNDLSGLFDRIWRCIDGAIHDWQERITAGDKAVLKKRSRASFINDWMCHRAKEEFKDEPNMRIVEKRGYLRLIIGGIYQVRLKKLDKKMRPSHIPTQTVMAFMRQLQATLPNMPESVTNLYAGYQWNATETAQKGVYIVCPNGLYHNEWVLEISEPRAQGAEKVAQFSPPLAEQPKRVVAKKTGASQQEQQLPKP